MGGGGPSGSTSQNYYVDVDVLGKVAYTLNELMGVELITFLIMLTKRGEMWRVQL